MQRFPTSLLPRTDERVSYCIENISVRTRPYAPSSFPATFRKRRPSPSIHQLSLSAGFKPRKANGHFSDPNATDCDLLYLHPAGTANGRKEGNADGQLYKAHPNGGRAGSVFGGGIASRGVQNAPDGSQSAILRAVADLGYEIIGMISRTQVGFNAVSPDFDVRRATDNGFRVACRIKLTFSIAATTCTGQKLHNYLIEICYSTTQHVLVGTFPPSGDF